MAGPIAIDTPDYQRGVVNAGKLLATVSAGVQDQTVALPPNTSTLVVVGPINETPGLLQVFGATTRLLYPGIGIASQLLEGNTATHYVDVSAAVDAAVDVHFPIVPAHEWFIWADSATRVIADISKATDQRGFVYTLPSAPDTASGDHPPVELQLASTLDSPNGTVLVAAPGAGERVRVFDAYVNAAGTSAFVALRSSVTSKQIIGVSATTANTAGRISCYPSGVVLPDNEGVNIVTSSGSADGTVTYTVETI